MRSTPWDDVLAARRIFGGIEMALWDARGKLEGVSLAGCWAAPCVLQSR